METLIQSGQLCTRKKKNILSGLHNRFTDTFPPPKVVYKGRGAPLLHLQEVSGGLVLDEEENLKQISSVAGSIGF